MNLSMSSPGRNFCMEVRTSKGSPGRDFRREVGRCKRSLERGFFFQGGQTRSIVARLWLRVQDRDCPCIVCNNIAQEARLKKQLHADYICSVPLFASRSLDRALSGTRESHLDYRETMKAMVTSVEA